MPALRLGLTAGLLGLVATAATAGAAPAACNLTTDAKGDATGFVVTEPGPAPNNPQLDLVSGDVATKGRTITAVIRTEQLALTDSSSPTGRTYYANFEVGGAQLFLAVALDRAGTGTYSAGYIDTRRMSLGEVKGVVDVAKKEIRISAPTAIFAERAAIKDGVAIQNLSLLAQRYVGDRAVGGATPTADDAVGNKTYIAGQPSCVPVGA